MNPILIAAVTVVTFALVLYSFAVITEQRKSIVSRRVLLFLTAGVFFDIASTALMIAGSRNIPFTVHGFLGYSALSVMLVDAVLMWRHRAKNADDAVPRRLNIYTRFAYGWWVTTYVAGAVISMMLK